jgi:hypothetical protein
VVAVVRHVARHAAALHRVCHDSPTGCLVLENWTYSIRAATMSTKTGAQEREALMDSYPEHGAIVGFPVGSVATLGYILGL